MKHFVLCIIEKFLFSQTLASKNLTNFSKFLPLHPLWAKSLYHLFYTFHNLQVFYKFIYL